MCVQKFMYELCFLCVVYIDDEFVSKSTVGLKVFNCLMVYFSPRMQNLLYIFSPNTPRPLKKEKNNSLNCFELMWGFQVWWTLSSPLRNNFFQTYRIWQWCHSPRYHSELWEFHKHSKKIDCLYACIVQDGRMSDCHLLSFLMASASNWNVCYFICLAKTLHILVIQPLYQL